MEEHTQKLAIELEKRVVRQRVAQADPADQNRAQDVSAQNDSIQKKSITTNDNTTSTYRPVQPHQSSEIHIANPSSSIIIMA